MVDRLKAIEAKTKRQAREQQKFKELEKTENESSEDILNEEEQAIIPILKTRRSRISPE